MHNRNIDAVVRLLFVVVPCSLCLTVVADHHFYLHFYLNLMPHLPAHFDHAVCNNVLAGRDARALEAFDTMVTKDVCVTVEARVLQRFSSNM